jgi:hypothetical protein
MTFMRQNRRAAIDFASEIKWVKDKDVHHWSSKKNSRKKITSVYPKILYTATISCLNEWRN